MPDSILPFSLEKSNEKLTGRGMIAVFDEYIQALGLPDQVDEFFPAPDSNRGIAASDYVRTLMYHFTDGGRHLEEVRDLKADEGFRELIHMRRMPGPDAMGNWLRRMGSRGREAALQQVNDGLARRYVADAAEADAAEADVAFVLDVDATIIESDKGDAKRAYDGTVGYHPMLAFLSDGTHKPCCSYVKFRAGNASAQIDLREATRHTVKLLAQQGQALSFFRSDSAGYQAKLTNELNQEGITYTITADMDSAVRRAIESIPEHRWQCLTSRDGFRTGREIAETIHTMEKSDHAFRLVLWREPITQPDLFEAYGSYRYGALITNARRTDLPAEAALHHHRGRGNAERFIGEAKHGLNLKYLPCGQQEANAMYFGIGLLCYNVLKLMQAQVMPTSLGSRMISTVQRTFFRLVGKATRSARQLTLQVRAPLETLKKIRTVRRNIYELSPA